MAAGIIGRRPRPNRPSRRKNPASVPQPTAPIKIVSASASGSVVTVTYDQPVAVTNTPQYTTDVVGAVAETFAKTGPATVAITFSASVAAATALNIPYDEPNVRNASGGFVSTSTFPV